jgi:hypothetical protein
VVVVVWREGEGIRQNGSKKGLVSLISECFQKIEKGNE